MVTSHRQGHKTHIREKNAKECDRWYFNTFYLGLACIITIAVFDADRNVRCNGSKHDGLMEGVWRVFRSSLYAGAACCSTAYGIRAWYW